MLHRQWLARTTSLVLCAVMSIPAVAAEAVIANPTPTRQVLDLKLREHGTLVGKLVNAQGQGLANANVQIKTKRGALTTMTDPTGVFAARGLTAGEMAVQVAGHTQVIRAWDAALAPPTAPSAALLVVGDAVRGQCCEVPCEPVCDDAVSCCSTGCDGCGGCDACGGCGVFGGSGGGLLGGSGSGILGGANGAGGVLSNPLILGAGVAAAVAIPLAIDDDDAS